MEKANFLQVCPKEMLNKLPHPLGMDQAAVPAEEAAPALDKKPPRARPAGVFSFSFWSFTFCPHTGGTDWWENHSMLKTIAKAAVLAVALPGAAMAGSCGYEYCWGAVGIGPGGAWGYSVGNWSDEEAI